MMATSASPPMPADSTIAIGNPTQYGTPHRSTETPRNAAPKPPISPCAKLMILLER